MIANLPVWVFVAAFLVFAVLVILMRGLRMPRNHAGNQERRELLKKKRAELKQEKSQPPQG